MLARIDSNRGHADLRVVRVMKPLHQLAYWIATREGIRVRKEAGEPRPWTDDPILATCKFCNVNREDDKITRLLEENWRTPHANDRNLWHAMAVARYINLPEALIEAGWPEPWNKRRDVFMQKLSDRQARGTTVFGAAYMTSNDGSTEPKLVVVQRKLDDIFSMPKPPNRGDELWEAFVCLLAIDGVGTFMAGQIVADLKYTGVLTHAAD